MLQRLFLASMLLLNMYAPLQAQNLRVRGQVLSAEGPVPGVLVHLESSRIGTTTSADGSFSFEVVTVPKGERLLIRAVGFINEQVPLASNGDMGLIHLKPDLLRLQSVVVSATRNTTDRREAAVMVNVSDARIFNATQAVSLSEGVSFQPGLRIENNCQNCGFTQLRMNGLSGPYTQILIDSRPVLSALGGVYGLEQIPIAMVDRVEVVRGGGSALYGANAIAGTVNIITKEPTQNSFQAGSNTALTGGRSLDQSFNFNQALVSEQQEAGISLFGALRHRNALDISGDGFSDITQMRNQSLGLRAFYKPTERSRLGVQAHHLREFRRGGDRLALLPHEAEIAEQLRHRISGGQLSYETYSASVRHRLSAYVSAQHIARDSYYGGMAVAEGDKELARNFYGNTSDISAVTGVQYTFYAPELLKGFTLTSGMEGMLNNVEDQMPGYQRGIKQKVNTLSMYSQAEWKLSEPFTILTGARTEFIGIEGQYRFGSDQADNRPRNFAVLNPRLSLLYSFNNRLQLRTGYARGFRAPQAFDEDLHIETLQGAAQFIRLSPSLKPETSDAFSLSLDYNQSTPAGQWYANLEGFYTRINQPFVLRFAGETLPGSNATVVDKENGDGALVAGINAELMFAPSAHWQWQIGTTLQRARYLQEEEVLASDEGNILITTRQMLRTPDVYGYAVGTWQPGKWQFNLSTVFTGSMLVANERETALKNTPAFLEINIKAGRTFGISASHELTLSGGVQNLFNSFQRDLETGPERDAGYVYGPIRPRTFFLGLNLRRKEW